MKDKSADVSSRKGADEHFSSEAALTVTILFPFVQQALGQLSTATPAPQGFYRIVGYRDDFDRLSVVQPYEMCAVGYSVAFPNRRGNDGLSAFCHGSLHIFPPK
jgi:hypothetical protein